MISFLQNSWLSVLLAAVCGYLLGSINWAIIITRYIFRKDIRTEGSGNAGATNVLRNHGHGPAILTTIGDIAKSMVAVVVGGWLVANLQLGDPQLPPDWVQQNLSLIGGYIGGFFCLLGHDFPVFYEFRGGKGVLTTLGMFLLLDWRVALTCLGVFIVLVAITRMVSLGSILSIGCGSALLYVFQRYADGGEFSLPKVWFCMIAAFLVWLLVVWKHRANIGRIFNGTESKLGQKK